MSKMIERLARVLFANLAGDPDWDDAYETREQAAACGDDDISQEECFDLARVAIAAMREPTEAMVAAGWIDKEDVNPDDIWRAMNDEALR